VDQFIGVNGFNNKEKDLVKFISLMELIMKENGLTIKFI